MLKGPFLSKDFIASSDDYMSSDIVLLGCPMDATVSNRSGCRFGPQAIRLESIGIETYSPVFHKEIDKIKFYDAGDLDLPFGNPQKDLDIIEENVKEIYSKGKRVLALGGEHLITYAEISAIKNFYKDIAVIQFDAHTDLRSEYLGETLTHSGVMHQIGNIIGFENMAQIGIRSGESFEFDIMKKYGTCLLDISELQKFKDKYIFLTIDLDVLDPSLMRGVGTPEAGGFTYKELIKWLKALKDFNIIGADIVELSPDLDPSKVSTATACTLVREVLCMM